MIPLYYSMLSALCLAMVGSGCAGYHVIPERLEKQVNHQLRFAQVQENPESYTGEIMVVGGEVLSIDRLHDMTRIEVLQLPLSADLMPANRRTTTEGRFIAVFKGNDPLDPAVLEKGAAISIVGEILGRETVHVGADKKDVPAFGIKDLTIWDESQYWAPSYYGYGLGRWNYTGHYAGYRPVGFPYY